MQEARVDGSVGEKELFDLEKMMDRLDDPGVKEFIITKKKEIQAGIDDLSQKIDWLDSADNVESKEDFQEIRQELEQSIERLGEKLDSLDQNVGSILKANSNSGQKRVKHLNTLSLKKRRLKNKLARKSRKKNR